MIQVQVVYYAVLREQSGRTHETVQTSAASYGELYGELKSRHGFTLDPMLIRVAVNGSFVPMLGAPSEGDSVVFIPPVAGG